jgi:outer membrane immunogenic protein
MTKFFAVAAALPLVLAAGVAQAGEFRAEVHGGYDGAKFSGTAGSMDGLTYGIGAGYDFSLAPMIFAGVEANLDDTNNKECAGAGTLADPKYCASLGRDISTNLRLGTSIGVGKLYVLAGYTNQRGKFSVAATAPGGGGGPTGGQEKTTTTTVGLTSTTVSTGSLDGVRVGAGYQFPILIKGYGKVEYRYSNYEAGVTRHQALIGLGLSF